MSDDPRPPHPRRKAEHDAFTRLVRLKIGVLVVCGAILFVIERAFG